MILDGCMLTMPYLVNIHIHIHAHIYIYNVQHQRLEPGEKEETQENVSEGCSSCVPFLFFSPPHLLRYSVCEYKLDKIVPLPHISNILFTIPIPNQAWHEYQR